MRAISQIKARKIEKAREDDFMIGTIFVIFFLSFEIGQTLFSSDLVAITLIAVLSAVVFLTYFLSPKDKSKFGNWLILRGLIMGSAIIAGAVFKQNLGISIPKVYGYLPMILLMVSSLLCCYFLFYSFFKLRFVK